MSVETAHEAVMLELGQGETLESYGYTPEDIITAEDATYERRGMSQPLVRMWVFNETEVEE